MNHKEAPKATITITLEADNSITTDLSHALPEGMVSAVWLGMLEIAKLSVFSSGACAAPKEPT
jgi:hypothetical protein